MHLLIYCACLCIAVLAIPAFAADGGVVDKPAAGSSRLVQLTEAMIHGVHWGQVIRNARPPSKDEPIPTGDPDLYSFGKIDAARAQQLFDSFKTLVKSDPAAVAKWATGGEDPAMAKLVEELRVDPIPTSDKLPVNVLIAYMRKRLTGPEEFYVNAVGNLCQLCLEVDHDGSLLQDMFHIYVALGVKKIDLPETDETQLADGKILSAQTGASPFGTDPQSYGYILKKVSIWSQKNSGSRDKVVLAKELFAEPEMAALIPALKTLPPQRVAFLGHSMMMSLHWSTYGSWCDVAAEAVKSVNPGFEYRGFNSGGLTPTKAISMHIAALVDYKPTDTYIFLWVRNPPDRPALESIFETLQRIGSRIHLVDDVRPAVVPEPDVVRFTKDLCARYGARYLDFQHRSNAVPGSKDWMALDGIHMKTEGHLFYAREALKMWAEDAAKAR